MVRRRSPARGGYGRQSFGFPAGLGAGAGKKLISQLILCIVIVLFAIAVKKLDHAMTNRALESVQTFMGKDYSGIQLVDSVRSAFSGLEKLPQALEAAMEAGKSGGAYIAPCNGAAIRSTLEGQEQEDKALQYSSAPGELQVYASSGGTVLSVEGEAGAQCIRISHGNGRESRYEGCTAVYAKPLEKVRKGQLIGSVAQGEGGLLRFSVWKDGQAIDPMDGIAF